MQDVRSCLHCLCAPTPCTTEPTTEDVWEGSFRRPDFSGYQFCGYDWDGTLPFCFWDYGTSSLPVTRRQMGYGVHGGSFELPKTRCLGSLNCTLRYFNTIVLNCKDVLSFSSCTKPSSATFSTPLCVRCFCTCNIRQLYRAVVLDLSCYRENGQGKILGKRSRFWYALLILGVFVLLGAMVTGVTSKGIVKK